MMNVDLYLCLKAKNLSVLVASLTLIHTLPHCVTYISILGSVASCGEVNAWLSMRKTMKELLSPGALSGFP